MIETSKTVSFHDFGHGQLTSHANASASGRFTNASFHHESGESMKPTMASTPPVSLRLSAMNARHLAQAQQSGKRKGKNEVDPREACQLACGCEFETESAAYQRAAAVQRGS